MVPGTSGSGQKNEQGNKRGIISSQLHHIMAFYNSRTDQINQQRRQGGGLVRWGRKTKP